MNIVGTLEDLISINSVTGDEESILDFIEDFLIKNNFNGEVVRNDEELSQFLTIHQKG